MHFCTVQHNFRYYNAEMASVLVVLVTQATFITHECILKFRMEENLLIDLKNPSVLTPTFSAHDKKLNLVWHCHIKINFNKI